MLQSWNLLIISPKEFFCYTEYFRFSSEPLSITRYNTNDSFEEITRFSSIWPIDRTLSDATTSGQSGPGSDGSEKVLHIPQGSSITGTSPNCLVSYQDTR